MAKKFSELRSRMSPESQARAEAQAQAMLAAMPRNELRQAHGLSQKMLAEVLQVQRPSIAKMEKRTDMYLSTPRSHIEAMGEQPVGLWNRRLQTDRDVPFFTGVGSHRVTMRRRQVVKSR